MQHRHTRQEWIEGIELLILIPTASNTYKEYSVPDKYPWEGPFACSSEGQLDLPHGVRRSSLQLPWLGWLPLQFEDFKRDDVS